MSGFSALNFWIIAFIRTPSPPLKKSHQTTCVLASAAALRAHRPTAATSALISFMTFPPSGVELGAEPSAQPALLAAPPVLPVGLSAVITTAISHWRNNSSYHMLFRVRRRRVFVNALLASRRLL